MPISSIPLKNRLQTEADINSASKSTFVVNVGRLLIYQLEPVATADLVSVPRLALVSPRVERKASHPNLRNSPGIRAVGRPLVPGGLRENLRCTKIKIVVIDALPFG